MSHKKERKGYFFPTMRRNSLFLLALLLLSVAPSVLSFADDDDYDYDYDYSYANDEGGDKEAEEEDEFDPFSNSFFDENKEDKSGNEIPVVEEAEKEEPSLAKECLWGGNCYNNTDNGLKTVADLDKVPYEETVADETKDAKTKVLDEEEEENQDEVVILNDNDEEQRLDYDYDSRPCNKDDDEDDDEPEVLVVYQSLPPNGAIIASVVFVVIIVAVLFYLPSYYRRKYAPVSDAVPTSEVSMDRREFDHMELGGGSGASGTSASVPEIRFQDEKRRPST